MALIAAVDKLVVPLTEGLFSKVLANILKLALILWDKAVNFFLRSSFVFISPRKKELIYLILFDVISWSNL